MFRVHLGPTPAALLSGITGALAFASVLLLIESPTAGIRYWGPVAIATAVSLGAAFGSQLIDALQHAGEEIPVAERADHGLSSVPAGEAGRAADLMSRFEEELRLAAELGRPLCVALLGLDREPGVDAADALEALRQLTEGTVRRQDVVADRGDTELLVMLPETGYPAGWVVAERIHGRVSAAGVGALRCVMLAPNPHVTLPELLDELDSGLEVTREVKVVFADPTRLLATTVPG